MTDDTTGGINKSIGIDKREIGAEAVWSLSTAKPGNGVEQIRDDNLDTYWQSDGAQPHMINIQFHKKMTVLEMALYLDYTLDESYTPKKISIKAGTTFHDLVEIQIVEIQEPQGWIKFKIRNPNTIDELLPLPPSPQKNADRTDAAAPPDQPVGGLVRAYFLQICIIAMHQNGRDTHVRQICITAMHQNGRDTHVRQAKVFGPRYALAPMYGQSRSSVRDLQAFCTVPEFTSTEFAQFSTLR